MISDFKSMADLAAQLFDVATMETESYRAIRNDGLARKQAVSAVGLTILYTKALDKTDHGFASSRAATTNRLARGVANLEREFPGVVKEAEQCCKETI